MRVAAVELLSTARTPPFEIEGGDGHDVDETLRLKYRYLDLRRAAMLANLELRHRAAQAARDYLERRSASSRSRRPMLTRSSPEGARDFLVPSRLQPHSFYALPQSPQMFKQILMVAGVDRYYQIARCFRDEDLRADRQPEHTQIDVEMSFMSARRDPRAARRPHGGRSSRAWGRGRSSCRCRRSPTTRRCCATAPTSPTCATASRSSSCPTLFAASGFQVFRGAVDGGGVVRAMRAPGGARLSRAQIDGLTELAKEHGARGMAYVVRRRGPRAARPDRQVPLRGRAERPGRAHAAPQPGDLIVFAADEAPAAAGVLGALRGALIELLAPAPSRRWSLLWVVEFPLFEIDAETGTADLRPQPVQPADRRDPGLSSTATRCA